MKLSHNQMKGHVSIRMPAADLDHTPDPEDVEGAVSDIRLATEYLVSALARASRPDPDRNADIRDDLAYAVRMAARAHAILNNN